MRFSLKKTAFMTSCILFSWGALGSDESVFVEKAMSKYESDTVELSEKLWNWSEVGYKETKSTEAMQAMLKEAGFTVKSGVAGIPTAFVASYGKSGPVVGILAEMDALPGLGFDASPEKQSIEGKTAGHACGHNLFAGGSISAAIIMKEWLESSGTKGQIRVYGTPAEEGGSGKVYMVREGVFDDADAMLHWHAGSSNSANAGQSLANKSAKFRFHGIASHAAAAPEKGRSALDAVEAMNYMVNMMREHVPEKTRIHYVITDGGLAPNVVPDYSEVYYYVRAPEAETVNEIWTRLEKTAEAAALGTETDMEYEVIGGTWNTLANLTLAEQMQASLANFGGLEYSPEEQDFADKIISSLGKVGEKRRGSEKDVAPFSREIPVYPASTDVGDVSWQIPTAGLSTATWVPGTSAHSWQAVAASGMSIGQDGMILAGKTIALTGIKLFSNPALIETAKEELEQRKEGTIYTPMVGDRAPALDYRD